MDKTTEISEMIDMLQKGEIPPGSKKGVEAIRQIAASNPNAVATQLFMINNDFLEKGMRAAGLTDEAIEDILKRDEPEDPFGDYKMADLRPKGFEPERSPFEIDPSLDIANGPRPPRR